MPPPPVRPFSLAKVDRRRRIRLSQRLPQRRFPISGGLTNEYHAQGYQLKLASNKSSGFDLNAGSIVSFA